MRKIHKFYNELDRTTSKHKKNKHLLLVPGDFNAKTGSGHAFYPENIGKHGKGHLNTNGEHLRNMQKQTILCLQTLFSHTSLLVVPPGPR